MPSLSSYALPKALGLPSKPELAQENFRLSKNRFTGMISQQ
jgi:hypothetical protein